MRAAVERDIEQLDLMARACLGPTPAVHEPCNHPVASLYLEERLNAPRCGTCGHVFMNMRRT